MCGIVGYMSLTGREEAVGQTVLSMLTGLARRGPDFGRRRDLPVRAGSIRCLLGPPAGGHWTRTSRRSWSARASLRSAAVRSVERRPGLVRLELAGRVAC